MGTQSQINEFARLASILQETCLTPDQFNSLMGRMNANMDVSDIPASARRDGVPRHPYIEYGDSPERYHRAMDAAAAAAAPAPAPAVAKPARTNFDDDVVNLVDGEESESTRLTHPTQATSIKTIACTRVLENFADRLDEQQKRRRQIFAERKDLLERQKLKHKQIRELSASLLSEEFYTATEEYRVIQQKLDKGKAEEDLLGALTSIYADILLPQVQAMQDTPVEAKKRLHEESSTLLCMICCYPYDLGPHIPYAMVPCGHTLCLACQERLTTTIENPPCPSCKKLVDYYLRLYI